MLPRALGGRRLRWIGVLPLVGVGAAYYMYKKRLASNKAITPAEFHEAQTAQINTALESTASLQDRQPFILYQYTTCPFCNKVATLLKSQELKFEVVEVDPLFKTEINKNGFPKVPQLRVGHDGPLLVDSDAINNYLAPLLLDRNQIEGNNVPQWRDWGNNVLARYLVINTNRSWKESFEGYDYVDRQNFGLARKWVVKIVGGVTMHLVSEYVTKKRLEPYGYAKGQNEREALFNELDRWGKELSEEFLHGGSQPDLADIEVYGILQSVKSFPVYEEMRQSSNQVSSWMHKMEQQLA